MYKEKTIEGKSLRAELLAKIENGLVEKKIESKEHSDNMMKLAQEFGVHLQLDNDEIESLVLLARLHDIGKITLSKEILLKND